MTCRASLDHNVPSSYFKHLPNGILKVARSHPDQVIIALPHQWPNCPTHNKEQRKVADHTQHFARDNIRDHCLR